MGQNTVVSYESVTLIVKNEHRQTFVKHVLFEHAISSADNQRTVR